MWLTLALLGCSADPAVTLWFGGDVYLGADRALLAEPLARRLRGAGLVNLEGTLGDGVSRVSDAVTLTHARSSLPALRGAGVRLASIANNHVGDGDAAATVSALAEVGVTAFGDVAGVATVDVGQPVVFAAWHVGAGDWTPPATELPLVVSLHVDGPPDPLPSPALIEAVDHAIAAGADVVVAHGTHGFGPVERRGPAVIAWGLGNLAFDCECTAARDGLVLQVTLGERPEATLIPIRAGLGGEPAELSRDPEAMLDVIEALGTPLERGDGSARLR